MFSEGLNTQEILSKSVQEAKQFLNGDKSIPIEEIENNILLQKSICKVMIELWKKPEVQTPFIDLIIELSPDVSFDMVYSIAEVLNEKNMLSYDDKNNWVLKVSERIQETQEDVNPIELNEYIKALLGVLNGISIEELLNDTDYLNENLNNENDDDDDNEEDYDSDEDDDDDSDEDDDYEDDEDEDEYDDYEENYGDYKNQPIVNREYARPIEKKKEIFSNDKPEMNPRVLATNVLSGKKPNEATLNILKTNQSFAKAYANALSLQTVISEIKGSSDIPYRFVIGVQYINEDIVYHAWNTLLLRRLEISSHWGEKDKEIWKNIIKSSKYSEDKIRKIYEILGWKYELKEKEVKKESSPIKISEDNNKFISKVKYYFDNISFEDPKMIENLTEEDKVLYARAISSQFVIYYDDPESNAIELYSYAVYELDIKTFEKAIDYLVEHFDLAGKTMNIDIKKDISSAIVRALSSLDLDKELFEKYQDTLINSITGYSKIEQK